LICRSFWNDADVIYFRADILGHRKGKSFLPSPFTGAGFLFAPSSMLREVPYDPNLPYLFQGEEILHTVRLWTSGYDFYTPSENIVYHHYGRNDKPKIWGDATNYNDHFSIGKVKYILRLPDYDDPKQNYTQFFPEYEQDRKKYGLGKKRTIDEYWKFVDVDIEAKTSKSRIKFCGVEEDGK